VPERAAPDPDVAARLREAVDSLPPGLRDHVYRVLHEARRLVRLYGIDEDRLELATLGHDLARAMSDGDLLAEAERFSLNPDEVERAQPVLLHGPVSAAIMASRFGIDDVEVLAAVRHHSTGAAGMGLLEKALFVADKIEVEKVREDADLGEVRRLAERDLDEAMLKYLDLHLLSAAQNGWSLHSDSVAARNELLLRRRR
jgi:predicted HD superfamily hydrolase involved in NAD metabolism